MYTWFHVIMLCSWPCTFSNMCGFPLVSKSQGKMDRRCAANVRFPQSQILIFNLRFSWGSGNGKEQKLNNHCEQLSPLQQGPDPHPFSRLKVMLVWASFHCKEYTKMSQTTSIVTCQTVGTRIIQLWTAVQEHCSTNCPFFKPDLHGRNNRPSPTPDNESVHQLRSALHQSSVSSLTSALDSRLSLRLLPRTGGSSGTWARGSERIRYLREKDAEVREATRCYGFLPALPAEGPRGEERRCSNNSTSVSQTGIGRCHGIRWEPMLLPCNCILFPK